MAEEDKNPEIDYIEPEVNLEAEYADIIKARENANNDTTPYEEINSPKGIETDGNLLDKYSDIIKARENANKNEFVGTEEIDEYLHNEYSTFFDSDALTKIKDILPEDIKISKSEIRDIFQNQINITSWERSNRNLKSVGGDNNISLQLGLFILKKQYPEGSKEITDFYEGSLEHINSDLHTPIKWFEVEKLISTTQSGKHIVNNRKVEFLSNEHSFDKINKILSEKIANDLKSKGIDQNTINGHTDLLEAGLNDILEDNYIELRVTDESIEEVTAEILSDKTIDNPYDLGSVIAKRLINKDISNTNAQNQDYISQIDDSILAKIEKSNQAIDSVQIETEVEPEKTYDNWDLSEEATDKKSPEEEYGKLDLSNITEEVQEAKEESEDKKSSIKQDDTWDKIRKANRYSFDKTNDILSKMISDNLKSQNPDIDQNTINGHTDLLEAGFNDLMEDSYMKLIVTDKDISDISTKVFNDKSIENPYDMAFVATKELIKHDTHNTKEQKQEYTDRINELIKENAVETKKEITNKATEQQASNDIDKDDKFSFKKVNKVGAGAAVLATAAGLSMLKSKKESEIDSQIGQEKPKKPNWVKRILGVGVIAAAIIVGKNAIQGKSFVEMIKAQRNNQSPDLQR